MTDNANRQLPKHVDQHAAMLNEALQRPGVREVMEVYGAWQRINEQLGTYRAAIMPVPTITTTNQANAK